MANGADDPISYNFAAGSLDPSVTLGSGLVPAYLQPNQLALSPDIMDATAANRPQSTTGGLQRSFQNPLVPPILLTSAPNDLAPRANLGPNVRYNSQGVPYNPDMVEGGQYGSTPSGVTIPARPSWEPAPGPESPVLPPSTPQTVTVPPHIVPGRAVTGTPTVAALPQFAAVPYNKYDIIRRFESSGPNADLSPSHDTDGSGVIGYGHTIQPGENFTTITPDQKELILRQDVDARIGQITKQFPGFAKLNSNQQEALISYYYNTGHLPGGTVENFGAGNMQAIGDAIRAGPYTAKQPGGAPSQYMHMLEVRRNAEADLFGTPEGQNIDMSKYTGAYASGDPIHGTTAPSGKPYAVGGAGAGVAAPPPQYGLTAPFVSDNPFAPRPPGVPNTPAQDLSELNARDRQFRALQLWSILGGMQKGVKFTPVSYNPFKVKQAGEAPQSGGIPAIQPQRLAESPVTRERIPLTRISNRIEGI